MQRACCASLSAARIERFFICIARAGRKLRKFMCNTSHFHWNTKSKTEIILFFLPILSLSGSFRKTFAFLGCDNPDWNAVFGSIRNGHYSNKKSDDIRGNHACRSATSLQHIEFHIRTACLTWIIHEIYHHGMKQRRGRVAFSFSLHEESDKAPLPGLASKTSHYDAHEDDL